MARGRRTGLHCPYVFDAMYYLLQMVGEFVLHGVFELGLRAVVWVLLHLF